MFLHKEGFPDYEELVLCTVTAVQFHSVFVKLDEYDKGGMIHISEVAPGRIRNIRDFVQEGKKVVCKVLGVNREKGHIDLSLRRVNEGQKKKKLNEIKEEQLAEKIIEQTAKQLKLDPAKIYAKARDLVFSQYGGFFPAFAQVAEENADLVKLGFDAPVAKSLQEMIKSRIKPPEVEIAGDFKVSSYDPDGMGIIKEAFNRAVGKGELSIRYKGGGTYHLLIKSDDFKVAEKTLKDVTESVLDYLKEKKATAEFVRAQ